MSCVMCNEKVSTRIKGKVNKTVVRPAMLFDLETMQMRKRYDAELEGTEFKMLSFSLRVTGMCKIRNEHIRGTTGVLIICR